MPEPISENPTRPPVPSSLPAPVSIYVSRPGWLNCSWPTAVSVVVVIGFLFSCQSGRNTVSAAVASVRNMPSVAQLLAPAPQEERALIITEDPKKQLNLMLTLSPRGVHSIVALKLIDVMAILRTQGSAIRLAVIDDQLSNAVAIEHLLRKSLPSSRIVVLKASSRSEDIAQMLLDVL